MIIDRILDRKDSLEYSPKKFYLECMEYGRVGDNITRAMDVGNEEDVKQALCQYIRTNEYNPLIIDYVNRLNWLSATDPATELEAARIFDKACIARESFSKLGKFTDDKIFIAVQVGSVYSDEYTGDNIKAIRVSDEPEDFFRQWCEIRDTYLGDWYWVFANGECICSGAVDADDVEIFEEYFGKTFTEVERHSSLDDKIRSAEIEATGTHNTSPGPESNKTNLNVSR